MINRIAVLMFLLLASFSASADVHVDAMQTDNHRFVFSNKKMRGAKVEVYHANGELITAQKLIRRKLIIDFSDVRAGSYTIVVKKGETKKEFQFEKR